MKHFLFATLFLALVATSCSVISPTGQVQLPTAQQLNAACAVETAAHKSGIKAPDCVAYYVMQTNCNLATLAPMINGMVLSVQPVVGSILTVAGAINSATCKAQGFYDAAPKVTLSLAENPKWLPRD